MANDPRLSRWTSPMAMGAEGAEAAAPAAVEPGLERWTTQGLADTGGYAPVNWAPVTGQNLEGTNNAFDTAWWDVARQQDAEQSQRGMRDRWTRSDATGIAVYDDVESGVKWGDVFSGGKRVGNLREGYAGFSKEQADDMLARIMLPAEVTKQAYAKSNGAMLTMTGSIGEEVAAQAKRNTEEYAKGLTAEDFQQDR